MENIITLKVYIYRPINTKYAPANSGSTPKEDATKHTKHSGKHLQALSIVDTYYIIIVS